MEIVNEKELLQYTKKLIYLGEGSQGIAYLDKNTNRVIKIYHDILEDDYDIEGRTEEEITRFKNIQNKTYIFPQEAIKLKNIPIGNITQYAKGEHLYKIDPLKIKLNNFIEAVIKAEEDTKELSKQGIKTFDVQYNTLYTNKKISVIDAEEYSYTDLEQEELYNKNRYFFNSGIMYFLVDTYFDEFVESNQQLNEMYKSKNLEIKQFLEEFKKSLSEYTGQDIERLYQAKQALNKAKHAPKLIRLINF